VGLSWGRGLPGGVGCFRGVYGLVLAHMGPFSLAVGPSVGRDCLGNRHEQTGVDRQTGSVGRFSRRQQGRHNVQKASIMSITAITVAKAIATAMKGEASIAGLYITAYGIAAQGIEAGVSLREVADLVTKEGCKANKDTVSDWAMAAPLVSDPTAWIAALESVYPGQHRRAHNLVGEVRMAKGRGVGKVRAILVPVLSLTDEATHEDRVKVIAKALRALKSEDDDAKAEVRAAKKKADEGQTDEGQTDEGQ